MDEIRARVIPHAAILQFQGSLADFTEPYARYKEIDRLPFHMKTATGGPAAAFD